jgi:YgiT-type zinc finger domain-containing protein
MGRGFYQKEEVEEMECPYCKGELKPGRATYTANRLGYHLLLDDIPAWVCQQCGEPVFEERAVEAIQRLLTTVDEGVRLARQNVAAGGER